MEEINKRYIEMRKFAIHVNDIFSPFCIDECLENVKKLKSFQDWLEIEIKKVESAEHLFYFIKNFDFLIYHIQNKKVLDSYKIAYDVVFTEKHKMKIKEFAEVLNSLWVNKSSAFSMYIKEFTDNAETVFKDEHILKMTELVEKYSKSVFEEATKKELKDEYVFINHREISVCKSLDAFIIDEIINEADYRCLTELKRNDFTVLINEIFERKRGYSWLKIKQGTKTGELININLSCDEIIAASKSTQLHQYLAILSHKFSDKMIGKLHSSLKKIYKKGNEPSSAAFALLMLK